MSTSSIIKPIEICIPRVSVQISRKQIFETFCKLNIGYIERITENPLRLDTNFKRIVIRIKWDNTQELAKEIQEQLKDKTNHMNVVYDMPWFWQIYANQPQK
jgi:branched-subunit amino acid aminotransferase/4-amino-4-deoxychorismate lyase